MNFSDVHKKLRVLRMGGIVTGVWPVFLKKDETLKKVLLKIWNVTYIFFIVLSLGPGVISLYFYRRNLSAFLKMLAEVTVATDTLLNNYLTKMHNRRIKIVMWEIDEFLLNATTEEMMVVRRYVNRRQYFLAYILCSFYSAAIIFCCAPMIVAEQRFPTDIDYPFSTEKPAIYYTLYFFQIIVAFQVASSFFMDLMVAYMIWFATVRLEVLCNQFTRVKDASEMRKCAKKHQHLIEFFNNIHLSSRYIILKCYDIMGMTMITGGYQLINHEPFSATFRFIMIVIASILRLYAVTKPADDLKMISIRIGSSILYSNWPDLDHSTKMNLIICLQRAEKPLVMSVEGLISELSMEHYSNFLSTTFKCFVNLRIVFEK